MNPEARQLCLFLLWFIPGPFSIMILCWTFELLQVYQIWITVYLNISFSYCLLDFLNLSKVHNILHQKLIDFDRVVNVNIGFTNNVAFESILQLLLTHYWQMAIWNKIFCTWKFFSCVNPESLLFDVYLHSLPWFLCQIILRILGLKNDIFPTSKKNLMASGLLGRSWSQLISMDITNRHMKLTFSCR